MRSVSVASFLSDGTIEIEGFGFDNASEIGDDASIYGESMYEGSVYEGEDRSDLSWKAERILANAKKKLDLCGQNISRARSSLILSPSTTPTSFTEQLESVAVLPRQLPSLHSQRFKFNNTSTSHGRTASESAVPRSYSSHNSANGRSIGKNGDGLGTIEDVNEHPSEIERPQSEMSSSKSTQQMRVLRDQMKDLRGKITSLQQQTRSDSMKRRSISSLRSTPNPYDSHDSVTPTLDDIKQERTHRGNENWRTIDREDDIPDDYSSRSGTPRPRPFRNSASPFEERHEDREDAFSYDSLFYGNGVYAGSNGTITRPMSYSSDGTNSTATAVIEPLKASPTSPSTMKRSDSHGSIESFETATEVPAPAPRHPTEPSPPVIASEWLTPAASSPRDDGYHSAPHTPRSPYSANVAFSKAKPPAMTNSLSNSSIYLPAPETQKSQKRKSSIAIGASESIDSVLVTNADNVSEIELKLDEGDRDLIERMIEGLGSFCCKMEMERREDMREEYRRRLECALRVLQGVEVYDDEDDGTF